MALLSSLAAEDHLIFEDGELRHSTMAQLNALRKDKLFCDVVISIDNHEIPAHRAVLACCSSYLFDIFNGVTRNSNGSHIYNVRLENVDALAVEKLIEFTYMARLQVPPNQVCSTYAAAKLLKINSVKKACAQFLAENITSENCIGLHQYAKDMEDSELMAAADSFITHNLIEVATHGEFLSLPRIKVEVVAENGLKDISDKRMLSMILQWAKRKYEEAASADQLLSKTHLVKLVSDSFLQDHHQKQQQPAEETQTNGDHQKEGQESELCNGIGDRQITPTKVTHLLENNNNAKIARQLILDPCLKNYQQQQQHSKPKQHSVVNEDSQWKLIAHSQTSESSFVGLISLGDRVLSSVFVIQRVLTPANSPRTPNPIPVPKALRSTSWVMIAPMNQARCGIGAAELFGKLVVAGGYDQGECLGSVEAYDPHMNEWYPLPPMITPRGRFEFGTICGKLFAVGGSDGSVELKCGECFDPDTNKWATIANLSTERHSSGAAVLNDKLYVIGGSVGSMGSVTCDVYDPHTNQWNHIASLNFGRSQAGVCSANGRIYVCGGSDSWNCLNSVEVYDPSENVWLVVDPMKSCRRGAGVCLYDGKIFVAGGSDGSCSLDSMECYDPTSKEWSQLSSMHFKRANMGIAVVEEKLYVVGGFDGKAFLNTIEYYDKKTRQWHAYIARS